jgi:hypothetical protein
VANGVAAQLPFAHPSPARHSAKEAHVLPSAFRGVQTPLQYDVEAQPESLHGAPIDWPIDLLHSSALSQAAPSARVPENAAQPSLGIHVLDCSSRRLMQAPSFDGSAVTVPLPTSPTTGTCRSNSDSQSESGSGDNPPRAARARGFAERRAKSGERRARVVRAGGGWIRRIATAACEEEKDASETDIVEHRFQPIEISAQSPTGRHSSRFTPVQSGALHQPNQSVKAPPSSSKPRAWRLDRSLLDRSTFQQIRWTQRWPPAVKPARRAHRIDTSGHFNPANSVLLEIHQHVHQAISHLARRGQRPSMIPVGENTTRTAELAIDRPREADRQTGRTPRQRRRALGFDDEMYVIGVHGKMHDAKVCMRRVDERQAKRAKQRLPSETGQPSHDTEGEMHRVAPLV